jgi:short-subunit dehydrogenase
MKLQDKRVVLTGAAGGMGAVLARLMHAKGAKLALVDSNEEVLQKLANELAGAAAIVGDLASREGCEKIATQAEAALGGVDLLVNLAGIMSFAAFEDEDDARIETLMHINLIAPMLLSRALLPAMLTQNSGRIVNIGSMFGSIGFAYFAAYSASKFGLRGFSQALRRELADTGVGVTYISPRAVKTSINSGPITRVHEATKTNTDEPDEIAAKILAAIEAEKKEAYFGFPESLFARINGILPGVVDNGTVDQNRITRDFAKGIKS